MPTAITEPFTLDPRLAADTHAIGYGPLSQIRLMNDMRYMWLILIPQCAGVTEWMDLSALQKHQLSEESDALCRVLKTWAPTHKLNLATLGNVVAQLHVHHVLRSEGDPAWPAPVWGHSPAVAYPAAACEPVVKQLRELLRAELSEFRC